MQKADHESTELCAVTYQLPAARGLGVADNTQELQIIQITKSRSYIQRCCSWEILYIKWRQKYTPLSPSSNPESHIHRSAEQLFIVKRKIPITDERNQKHTNATRNRVTPQKSEGIKKNEAEDEIYFCPVEYTAFSSLLFFQGREEEQECNLCGSDACLLWRGHTPNLQLPQIRQCQQGWEQSPGLLCQQVLYSHCTWQRKKKKRKKRVEKCLPEAVVRFSVEILKWLARKARLPYRDQLLHLVKFFEEQRNTR